MKRCAIALLAVIFSSKASGASDDLAYCAKLESIDERLACYDELARATDSPAGWPVDSSPTPSHLSEVWKLGAKQASARRLTDIIGYRPTYILSRWTSEPNEQPADMEPNELKFQVSFKAELASRHAFDRIGVTPLLRPVGIDSVRLWFGYTQRVHWQVYNSSASRPFRETNYEPEAILTFGRGNEGDGFKLVNLGLVHQSNGRTGADSRGWNRLYAQGGWEWGKVSLLARLWYRIAEKPEDDDNPDIKNYLGNADLVARYQTAGGYVSGLLVRRKFVQLDWATPLMDMLGAARLHLQVSSGYGESLIDYNHKQTTLGLGVSFGDW